MEKSNDELKRDIVERLTAERWHEALPLLELWCERFPDHARSWLYRGCCLFHLERFQEAVAAFDRCIELQPESDAARGWRNRTCEELDRGHTVARGADPSVQPADVSAGDPGLTQRAAQDTQTPPSLATMGIPEARRDWQAGSVVDGRYEVRALARGGMAVVAVAFDQELRRMVAIKTPLPSVLASKDGGARFQREAESWIALGVHPNICCAYYLQDIGGMPRLFIEYVDGGDLNQWLKRNKEASLEERLDIAIQIASGLDYTHTFLWTDDDGVEHQGLVHRDIKPANVLMTRDGIARVTDFGLVRAEGVEDGGGGDDRQSLDLSVGLQTGDSSDSVASGTWQTVTVEGGLVGTPPYMAPELWKHSLRGTLASDIYAYGCLLYEVLCGRRPFVIDHGPLSQTREALLGSWMGRHLKDDPPDPRSFDDTIQPRLAALMRACIAKVVSRRPQSFGLLRSWLVEIYEQISGRPYPRPEPKRTRLLADSLNNRGASFITLGLADRAGAAFAEALAVDPRHLQATFNSGLLEWRRDGLSDAELERRLSEAERSFGTGSAGLLRARLRLLLDDPEGALKALNAMPTGEREGLAARREEGFAMLASARAAGDDEGFAAARERIRSVIVESPSDLPAIIGFAETCMRLGDTSVAEEAFAAARSIDRDLPENILDAAAQHLPGHRLLQSLAHGAPVRTFVATGDGRIVARSSGSEAVVWDRDGTVVLRIELGGTARQGRSMAVAGGELVAYLENEAITLFDLASGERTRSFSTHPGVATCLALSPDGLVVASGGSDRNLRLWNFRTGECDSTFEGHGAFLSAVAWHPTQPRLVSASADGTLRVWDVGRGVCEQILTGHGAAVRAVAVDPTGSRVVSTGEDGSVGVWRLHDGELVRFQRGHRGVVNSLAVAAGMIAAGGEDGTVRLWKMESGETIQVMRMPNPVQDLAATKGGSEILAAHGGTISRLAVPGPEPGRMPLVLADTAGSSELAGRENEFQHHLLQAKERIDAGQMEEALEPLRAARSLEGYELHDQALELWSRVLAYYPKHESRSVVELRRFGGGRIACNACAFVGEGAGCVAGFTDGSLRFFETESGSERYRVGAHDQSTLAVASSKDGRWLATAGRDGAVRVWNAADGRLEREYGGHSGSAQAVVFTPDGRSAVSGGDDGTVRIWSLDESVLPELLGSSGEAISALAVSTDGRYLVSGGWDSQVTIWSLRRRAELRRLQGHEGTVHGVAVSPDCRLMASAGEDGTIRLWDLESGRCWRELRGHDGAVLSVAFAPDGRFVLSAGKDSSLRLWDVRTGKVATTVEGHDGPVGCVALARDGGAALSSGTDASVRLWFLDWEPELPERGTWDDRVLPFLKVFIRRRESESPQGAMPTWGEHHLEELLKDLNFRGFGWLSRERVERELEKLAQFRSESRTEEREHTQQLVRQRERASRLEPVKELVGQLTHNIGLKVAAVGLAIAAVLLGLMSLRTPTGGPEFSRFQRDISMMIQAREMRLDRGTVLSYQTRASVGSQGCAEGHFPDFVDLAVEAERMRSPPLDPAVPADEGFRLRYANAVNCVGTFGTYDLADRILQRIRQGIHERREEDLLGVLVRIKASANPRFADGLLDANESVRHMVALAIVYGDDQESRERLASALQGDELRAAEAASFVIGELVAKGLLGEEEAFEVIRTLSRNIDPMVRRNAVKSLILYKNEGIVREVLNDALEDSDPDVVKAAEVTREAMRTGRIKELFG